MNESVPWVHKFQTRKNRYLLDVNTNRVLCTDPVTWELVDEFGKLSERELIEKHGARHGPAEVASACADIVRAQQESGLLLPRQAELAPPQGLEAIREALESKRRKITLSVTEECNFRCDYCVHGGDYQFWRPHSKRKMTWAVAQRAIDDYLAHSHKYEDHIQGTRRSITFYGGEPLLNMSVIKKCIAYTRGIAGDQVIFHVTTNGYLLKGPLADYLASEDVTIQVSLDGPAHAHDRHRRTAGGAPTWKQVVENIREFLRRHAKYCQSDPDIPCLGISVTVPPLANALEIDEFFAHQLPGLLGFGVDTRFTNVRASESRFIQSLAAEDRAIPGVQTLRDRFLASAAEGLVVRNPRDVRWSFQRSLCQEPFLWFMRRKVAGSRFPVLDGRARLMCMCVPGRASCFVAVDGSYYPCGRVPTCETFKIGDVGSGLDAARCHRLKNEFERMGESDCRDCWCVNCCHAGCLAGVRDGPKVTAEAKKRACERHRADTHRMLVDLYGVLEVNPAAFDHLKPAGTRLAVESETSSARSRTK